MDKLNIWELSIVKDKNIIQIEFNPCDFKDKVYDKKHGILSLARRTVPSQIQNGGKN